MKTGIQVSSFRPVLQTPEQVQTAFEKMVGMGCRWVQLQWINPAVPVEWIARCLRQSGCISVGLQDRYDDILKQPEYYIDLNRVTGAEWFCVGRIPQRLRSRAGLDEYVKELRALQQRLEEVGQKLCFHAVTADFAPIDGLDPVEYLLNAMPELPICADLYHLSHVYADVPGWLRRYAGRVCMVHFKDGRGNRLVPVGQGEIDYDTLLKVCLQAGVEYGFVEQEQWEGDPFERLQESFDWLNKRLEEQE